MTGECSWHKEARVPALGQKGGRAFTTIAASNSLFLSNYFSFFQQETPQAAQVIQRAAACMKLLLEFLQLVMHDSKRLQAALQPGFRGCYDFTVNVTYAFADGFAQKLDVFLSIFDAVKRSFNSFIHRILLCR